MNSLALGITIALRDAFSSRARLIERQFRSLDNTTGAASRSLRRSLGDLESGMWSATRTLVAGAMILGSALWPTREAMAFSRAISQVSTIADYASTNLGKLRNEIIDLSLRFPQDPINITEALYETVSSGFINTGQALRVIAEGTSLGVATITDAQTATDGLTSVMMAYKIGASEADHVSNLLFETIRYGKVRMHELAHTIGMVASVAAAAHIPLEEMLGAYATMTLAGLSPEQAAQYSRQIIAGIIKPTRQSAVEAEKLGIQWDQHALKVKGLRQLLLDAWAKTGALGNVESFGRLLSGRQAITGATALINQTQRWGEVIEGIADYWTEDEFGILTPSRLRAERERAKALDYQWERLKSAVTTLAIVVGTASVQFFQPFVKWFVDVVEWATKLLRLFPPLTHAVTAFAVSVGLVTVAFGVLQLRTTLLGRGMLKFLTQMRRTRLEIFGMRMGLWQAVRTFTGAFILIGLGVALLRRAWDRNWGGIQEKVRNTLLIVRAVSTALSNMSGVWGAIPEQMARQLERLGLWELYVQVFMFAARVKFFFKALAEGIKGAFRGIADAIGAVVNVAASVLDRVSPPLANMLRLWWQTFNLNKASIKTWMDIGYAIGKVLGYVIALVAVTKLWGSGLFLARGLMRMLSLAARGPLLPFLLLRKTFVGVRRDLALIGRDFRSAAVWAKRFFLGIDPKTGSRVRYDSKSFSFRNRRGQFTSNRNAGLIPRLQRRVHMTFGVSTPKDVWNKIRAGAANAFGTVIRTARSAGQAMVAWTVTAARSAKAAYLSVGGIRGLGRAFMVLGRAVWASTAAFLASPWGKVALAVAAVIAVLVLLVRHWDWVKARVTAVFTWLHNALQRVPDWFLVLTGPLSPMLLIVKHWDRIREKAGEAMQAIRNGIDRWVRPALEWVSSAIQRVKDTLGIGGFTVEGPQLAGKYTLMELYRPANMEALKKGKTDVLRRMHAELADWMETNRYAAQTGAMNPKLMGMALGLQAHIANILKARGINVAQTAQDGVNTANPTLDQQGMEDAVTKGVLQGYTLANSRFNLNGGSETDWSQVPNPFEEYERRYTEKLAEKQETVAGHGGLETLGDLQNLAALMGQAIKILASKEEPAREIVVAVDGQAVARAVEKPLARRNQQRMERTQGYVPGIA